MGLFLSSHFPRLFLLFRPGLGAPRQGSVAPVAARWHDCDERVEVEIDNGLKRLGGGTAAQAVGQRIMPSDILGLQLDQPGDGVVPTLSSGPSVRRPTVTDLGKRLVGLATGAISSLSFGVAEGVLAIWLATDTVQNLGVVRPFAETGGGPNVRPRHGPG
jgi:hypothetical protein